MTTKILVGDKLRETQGAGLGRWKLNLLLKILFLYKMMIGHQNYFVFEFIYLGGAQVILLVIEMEIINGM